MPEPYSPRATALDDALRAAGTPPSSKRKAALLDALKAENKEPKGGTSPAALSEAVKTTT